MSHGDYEHELEPSTTSVPCAQPSTRRDVAECLGPETCRSDLEEVAEASANKGCWALSPSRRMRGSLPSHDITIY